MIVNLNTNLNINLDANLSISNPQFYHGTDTEYHSLRHLGSTDLVDLLTDYKVFKHNNKPDIKALPKAQALVNGSAIHKYVLEGEEIFNNSYTICEFSPRTKAFKEFCIQNKNKFVITKDLHEACKEMKSHLPAQAIRYIEKATSIEQGFTAGIKVALDPEHVFSNKQTHNGLSYNGHTVVEVKGKADILIEKDDHILMVDYKTTCNNQKVNKYSWKYEILARKYHIQAAHYKNILEALHPDKKIKCAHLVQSKSTPYISRLFILDEDLLSLGLKERNKALKIYQRGDYQDDFIQSFRKEEDDA